MQLAKALPGGRMEIGAIPGIGPFCGEIFKLDPEISNFTGRFFKIKPLKQTSSKGSFLESKIRSALENFVFCLEKGGFSNRIQ